MPPPATLRRALLLAALLLPPAAARAAEFDEARLARIRPAMQRFVDERQIAGAVTVVGSAQGVASLEAIGNRRVDPNVPMTKDSLFRIASMTKPITAAGVLVLADDGKLSVDDPVEKHLPEFRGQMQIEK